MNQDVSKGKSKKGKKSDAESTTGAVGGSANGGNGEVPQDASTETKKGGSNAPRARKFDYGIKPEAKVVRLVEAANVKRDIQVQFTHTEGDPTVAQFYERGGDRHGLRVMSRRKLIKIVHEDGTEFPKEYVKPAPKAAEAKDGETVAA